jgi:heme-NO-binding protein
MQVHHVDLTSAMQPIAAVRGRNVWSAPQDAAPAAICCRRATTDPGHDNRMYGLVNKAVVDLVVTKFGQETWTKIKQKAEVDVDVFVSMDAYPDDVTYRLVGAASEVLKLPAEQVLEAFGEWWVLYTANEGYGPLLDASGSTLRDFLLNLDALHARVALTMPALKPPRFRMVDVDPKTLKLEYYSGREGLAPMVVGLLKGLGIRFKTPIEISHAPEGDHHAFTIRLSAAS